MLPPGTHSVVPSMMPDTKSSFQSVTPKNLLATLHQRLRTARANFTNSTELSIEAAESVGLSRDRRDKVCHSTSLKRGSRSFGTQGKTLLNSLGRAHAAMKAEMPPLLGSDTICPTF